MICFWRTARNPENSRNFHDIESFLTEWRFTFHHPPPTVTAMTTVAATWTMMAAMMAAAAATAARFTGAMMAVDITTMLAVRFGDTA